MVSTMQVSALPIKSVTWAEVRPLSFIYVPKVVRQSWLLY